MTRLQGYQRYLVQGILPLSSQARHAHLIQELGPQFFLEPKTASDW